MRDPSCLKTTLLVLLALATSSPRLRADEPAAKLAELKASAQAALEQKTTAEKSLQSLADQQTAINGQLIQRKSAPSQAQRTLKADEALLKTQQEELKKSQTARDQAKAPAEAAVKKATESEAAAKAKPEDKPLAEALQQAVAEKDKTAKALTDAEAAVQKAQAVVSETDKRIASAKDVIAKAPEQIKQTEGELNALEPKLAEARTRLETVSADWLTKERAVEAVLISEGKLVSFSDSVAPIFAERCLACHNARIAKGRLNLETFAALLKGGESGPSIEPGDPDSSYLFLLVDDGSMPKEADPLTKDEIAVLKKWIETGSELNAGHDPESPLIEIMPKRPQPKPPESYRVPLPVTALAFSPDGKLLASSGYHEVLLWNPEDGKLVRRITNVAERVYDLKFDPAGKTLAVAAGTPGQLGELKLFNVEDGALLGDFGVSGDSLFAASFSPDGHRLASGGADRIVRVFDVASGRQEIAIEDHADWVMGLAFSPDGKHLASVSRDKTAKVFDAETGDSVITFNGHSEPVYSVGFSPDGKQVVTAGADKQIRLWNLSDAKQVRAIGGFGGEVFRLQVTKDSHVFSASADKSARLHNLGNGQAVKTYSGHGDWVYAVAHSPATDVLATGSYNGEIRLWNAKDGKPLRDFIAAPGR